VEVEARRFEGRFDWSSLKISKIYISFFNKI
jgi:hypothetical protein